MKINILLCLIVSLAFTSCEKDTIGTPQNIEAAYVTNLFKNMTEHEYSNEDINITLISNGLTFSDEPSTIEIIGYVTDSLGNSVYIDTLLFNSELIEQYPNSVGTFRNIYGFWQDLEDGIDFYGDTLNIYIPAQDGVLEAKAQFYLPELVNFTDFDHNDPINIDEDLKLTWNVDTLNELNIVLNITGYSEPAGSNTRTILASEYIWTVDDGVHTISSSILQGFKESDYVILRISRGNEVVVNINENRDQYLYVIALTYASSNDIDITTH